MPSLLAPARPLWTFPATWEPLQNVGPPVCCTWKEVLQTLASMRPCRPCGSSPRPPARSPYRAGTGPERAVVCPRSHSWCLLGLPGDPGGLPALSQGFCAPHPAAWQVSGYSTPEVTPKWEGGGWSSCFPLELAAPCAHSWAPTWRAESRCALCAGPAPENPGGRA